MCSTSLWWSARSRIALRPQVGLRRTAGATARRCRLAALPARARNEGAADGYSITDYEPAELNSLIESRGRSVTSSSSEGEGSFSSTSWSRSETQGFHDGTREGARMAPNRDVHDRRAVPTKAR